MIEQVPEFADGGYWYVVPAHAELGDPPGWNTGLLTTPLSAWFGEIGGVMYAAIKVLEPISGIESAAPDTVDAVLTASGSPYKPYERSAA